MNNINLGRKYKRFAALFLSVCLILTCINIDYLNVNATMETAPSQTEEGIVETENIEDNIEENVDGNVDIETYSLTDTSEEVNAAAEATVISETEEIEETNTDIPEDVNEKVSEETTGEVSDMETVEVTSDTEAEETPSENAVLGNETDVKKGKLVKASTPTAQADGEIVFDISKGNIVIGTGGQYSGVLADAVSDSEGNYPVTTGTHSNSNCYIISQSNNTTVTENTLKIDSNNRNIVVYLSNVNMDTGYDENANTYSREGIPAVYIAGQTGSVNIILRGNNTIKSGRNHAAIEKAGNSRGFLFISCEESFNELKGEQTAITAETSLHKPTHSCNEDCGSLYAQGGGDIVMTSGSLDYPPERAGDFYSAAGIGTCGHASNKNNGLYNLSIAGGNIHAIGGGTLGAPGIGVGVARSANYVAGDVSNLNFYGGIINAHALKNSEAGAGIGGGYRSGDVSINFYGGEIYANKVELSETRYTNRASGIGSGGGGAQTGSQGEAHINIYDGYIEAYSIQGAAIGSGGGGTNSDASSHDVFINISGGVVKAFTQGEGAAIGSGGTIGYSTGDAEINITGGEITADSVLGAGIGTGGTTSSHISSSAGNATVTISNDSIIKANTGGIGGGKAVAGSAGNATVTIHSGNVEAASIGGGSSQSGKGGDVSVLSVTGGIVTAEYIGGGTSIDGNGGNVEQMTISGGRLTLTGNVGGGDSTNGEGGTANVTINGGTVIANNIGGGKSTSTDIYGDASIIITGGSLNSGMSRMPVNDEGEDLHLSLNTVVIGEDKIANALVTNINITKKDDTLINYGINDVWSDGNGTLYFWLPKDNLVNTAAVTKDGATTSLNATMKGDDYILSDTDVVYYTVRFPYDDYYTIYTGMDDEGNLINPFTRTCITIHGRILTLYVKPKDGYSLDIYRGEGTSQFTSMVEYSETLEGGIYKLEWYVTANTDMFAIATDEATNESRVSLDLSLYPISINEGKNGTHNLQLGGYSFDGYDGTYLLTSGKTPTSNRLSVNADAEVHINELTVESSGDTLHISNGANFKATVSNTDNSIQSTEGSAVIVDEGSSIELTLVQGNSLKLESAQGSAIDGRGDITINRTKGNLSLISEAGEEQITGNLLSYNGQPQDGIPYTFHPCQGALIGYHDGDKLLKLEEIGDITGDYTSCTLKYILPHDVSSETPTYEINAEGALSVSVPIGTYVKTITQNEEDLSSPDDYSISGDTVILSKEICSGNLEVIYRKDNSITYSCENYEKEYDAKPYTFKVKVYNPADCSVEYSWNKNGVGGYTTYSSDEPEFTDAGVYSINWTITPATDDYESVSGQSTVTITKAKNEWVSEIICPTVLIYHQPNPTALARYQRPDEPKFRYYEYNGDDTPTTIDVTTNGKYWVEAYVEETENYEGIVSERVQFVIEDEYVATGAGRILEKNAGLSNVKTVETTANGAVTLFYGFRYTPDDNPLEFHFSTPLPVGTKITLMDLCDTHSNDLKFYYYKVETPTSLIESDDFHDMGKEDDPHTFEEGTTDTEGIVVEYQLCIDFPENADITGSREDLIVSVNRLNVEMFDPVTITRLPKENSPTGNLRITAENENNTKGNLSARIDIDNANKTEYVLTVSLLKEIDGNYVPVDYPADYISSVKLNNKAPTAVRRSFAVFAIDVSGTQAQYNLNISRMKAGNYKLEAALCTVPTDTKYPMATKIATATEDSITVATYVPTSVTAIPDTSKRIFDSAGGEIEFEVNVPSGETDMSRLDISILKKEGTGYAAYTGSQITLNGTTVHVAENTTPGTYRILFTYGDAEYPYNIIVE